MMKNYLKYTGGAWIGFMNASWPLAKLRVYNDKIELSALLLGNYQFSKEQVTEIKKYTLIPFLGWGIRIHHSISSYPERIIFWSLRNPQGIIDEIDHIGFYAKPQIRLARDDKETPKGRGLPFRVFPVAIVVLIWNALISYDFKDLIYAVYNNELFRMLETEAMIPGLPSLAALLLMFITTAAIKINDAVAKIFLKPHRELGEVLPIINLVLIISGVMLAAFTVHIFIMSKPGL